jgi:hypothetical protein
MWFTAVIPPLAIDQAALAAPMTVLPAFDQKHLHIVSCG